MKTGGNVEKNCLQKVLILGIFIGLFFSNAEGVSLLPFPPSAMAITSDRLEDGSLQTSYNQNVKPVRSTKSGITKTKTFQPAVGGVAYAIEPRLASECVSPGLEWLPIGIGHLTYHSATTRGPPAI